MINNNDPTQGQKAPSALGGSAILPWHRRSSYEPDAPARGVPQSPRWRVGLVCARMRNFLAGVIVARPTRRQIFAVNGTAPACHDRGAGPGLSTSEMIQEDMKTSEPQSDPSGARR